MEAIISSVLFILLVVVFILIKRYYGKKEKTRIRQLVYLSGNSIREGNLSDLANIPLHLMEKKKEEIHNQLCFLFWTNPQGLIHLINLEIDRKEKYFLDAIMFEILSFSKQNATLAASKVLESELPVKDKTLVVSYIVQHLKKEKQLYFINFFRDTFKKIGDPMEKEIEEAIGEKL